MAERKFFKKILSPFIWLNILAMVIIVTLLSMGLRYGLDIYTHHGQTVEVPSILHKRYNDADFRKGGDPVNEHRQNVYRTLFAGISVTAAQGWRYLTEWELADRNGYFVPDRESIGETADRESARCVMRLQNEAGASVELSFIRSGVFGEEGWEQYAQGKF